MYAAGTTGQFPYGINKVILNPNLIHNYRQSVFHSSFKQYIPHSMLSLRLQSPELAVKQVYVLRSERCQPPCVSCLEYCVC